VPLTCHNEIADAPGACHVIPGLLSAALIPVRCSIESFQFAPVTDADELTIIFPLVTPIPVPAVKPLITLPQKNIV
jgi:hypothetical protein